MELIRVRRNDISLSLSLSPAPSLALIDDPNARENNYNKF